MLYDSAAFHVVERQYWGLTRKHGGNDSAAIAQAGSGTTTTPVTRFYPKGPIDIVGFGIRVLATLATAANATGATARSRIPFRLYKSTSNGTAKGTVMATFHLQVGDASPTAHPRTALYGVASDFSPASSEVERGRYLTVFTGTPSSDDGTLPAAAGTMLRTGSYALFLDYNRKYTGGEQATQSWEFRRTA